MGNGLSCSAQSREHFLTTVLLVWAPIFPQVGSGLRDCVDPRVTCLHLGGVFPLYLDWTTCFGLDNVCLHGSWILESLPGGICLPAWVGMGSLAFNWVGPLPVLELYCSSYLLMPGVPH